MPRYHVSRAERDRNDRELLEAAPAVCEWIAEAPDRGDAEDAANRAHGAMLGLLCGNALGGPAEGRWRTQIEDEWPGGEIAAIEPHYAGDRLDDDAAQAAELARALLEANEGDLAEAFARRMVNWLDTNGRGAGGLTKVAIRELRTGKPPLEASRAAYAERPIGPNGALMRCAPAAIAHYRDPGALVRVTALTGAVTHWSWSSQWATVVFNATLARLLRGDPYPPLDTLPAALEADGAPAEVADRVAAAASGAKGIGWLRLAEGLTGHALLALQAGLWAATKPPAFGEGLVELVSAGGDADTNGAIGGAALGARFGATEIPKHWLDALSLAAVAEFGSLAERLLAAGERNARSA